MDNINLVETYEFPIPGEGENARWQFQVEALPQGRFRVLVDSKYPLQPVSNLTEAHVQVCATVLERLKQKMRQADKVITESNEICEFLSTDLYGMGVYRKTPEGGAKALARPDSFGHLSLVKRQLVG